MANCDGIVGTPVDSNPKLVFVFSGKRKSGKDYLTDELLKLVPKGSAVIIRLSGPLKEAYAKEKGLDFKRLLDASEYKEMYRQDMVIWGEKKRNEDPEFFCNLALGKYGAENFPIWIISDARRKTDLDFFRNHYKAQSLFCRVEASDDARRGRGWQFKDGIDDGETECGLDDIDNWDCVLNNDGGTMASDLLNNLLLRVEEVMRTA